MTSPTLARLNDIVLDLVDGDRDTAQTLARLRALGFTADQDALAEAVHAIQLRDLFLSRQGNPWSFVGRPTAPLADVWDLAVDKAETAYSDALLLLARPATVGVAV